MKHSNIIFLIIIIFGIISIASILPYWNLSYSSINLLENKTNDNNYEYLNIIFNQTKDNVDVTLYKIISINYGIISQSNNIMFIFREGIKTNEFIFLKKNWEDISNIYFIEENIFICPKGKNFLHYYNDQKLIEIKPDIFPNDDEDWDLKCYYPNNNKTIFFTFLNNNINIIFNYKIKYKTFSILSIEQNDKIFDFKWEILSQNKNRMIGLFLFNSKIYLRILDFDIKDINTFEINKTFELEIQDVSNYNYSYAFFTHNNYTFYWMAHNQNTDLFSGYKKYIFKYEDDKIDISDKDSKINNKSSLNFGHHMNLITLKSKRNTKYTYYELLDNQNNNLIYRGIIDLSSNQVVFNTKEYIKYFRPFSPYSMLLINNISAYEICIIKDNKTCIENCRDGKYLIMNPDKGNYCSFEINCKKIYYCLKIFVLMNVLMGQY